MSRADNYSLLLLAGGKSSRMGSNKAELLYKGRTFVENSIDKMERLGIKKIFLSGYERERSDLEVVWDTYREMGPLGGLHACMKRMKTPYCLVLPVDVPQIPVEFLDKLLAAHELECKDPEKKKLPFLLKHEAFMEPLIGIYPVTMVDFIEERMKENRLSVFRMIEAWGCVCFQTDIPAWQVANLNTPEEYEKLLKRV